ncbi:MAG TPA: hypothetical protein VML75_28005 [Kofleriaceae bacterium]|nr:hypothetical protein [Kofleriaceae bacterium]
MRWRATAAAAALVTSMLVAAGTARAGRSKAIGSISATELRSSEGGELVRFGDGVGAAITFLELDREFTAGFEGSTMFLAGADGARLYNLAISAIAGFGLRDTAVAPFIIVGLDLAAAAEPHAERDPSKRNVMAGVHGGIGLHGFLSDRVYWRGQVGFIGAAVGGITGQLALGYVFGD